MCASLGQSHEWDICAEEDRYIPPATAGATNPVGDDDDDGAVVQVSSAATGSNTGTADAPAPLNKAFWELSNATTVDQTVMDFQYVSSYSPALMCLLCQCLMFRG